MLQRLAGGVALALGAMAAWAQASSAPAGDARALPMQFELLREGPAGVCDRNCRTLVSAVGAVISDTSADFAAFARDHDIAGATLVLDSSGGSVLGTLALGRAIRRLGMTTTVGKIRKISGGADDGRATLSPDADCESMCAFLLLAGKERFVPPEAQVLVHEIWLGDRRDDAAAATYSAEDIVLVQRDIGRLAQYTVEMGGSIDLLETALRIPPWEPMRLLSSAELRRMGLDTIAGLPEAGSQAIAVPASGPSPARTRPSVRGWTVSEKSDQPSLRRQHPLTLEGDEIGSFEIAFACGASAESYEVNYFERRRNANTKAGMDQLKKVVLSVGHTSIPLKIVTSDVQPKQTELNSVARGIVPMTVMESLAQEGNRSLVVKTATAGRIETAIRIGNTGVSQNLSQLAANCRAKSPPRADAHAELLPEKATQAANATPQK